MHKLLNLTFVLFLFGFLVFFVLNSGKGFDITDESFYLLWAMQPENVYASYHPFGFITKYVWFLSDKSIENFRILSVVILFLVTLLFAVSLNYFFQKKQHQEDSFTLEIFSIAALSATGFIYFTWWLISVSYNLLSFASCLLVMSGLFLAYGESKARTSIVVIGGILVGFAGFVAFLSKPTTAFFLAIIVIVWMVYYRHIDKKYYFLIFASMSMFVPLLLHTFLVMGGIGEFYTYLSDAIYLDNAGEHKHEVDSIITAAYIIYKDLILTPAHYLLYTPVFILLFIALFVSRSKIVYKKYREKLALLVTIYFLTLFFIEIFNLNNKVEVTAFFTLSSIVLFLTVVVFNRFDKSYEQEKGDISVYVIVALSLFILPFAYSFGTNNNLLSHSYNVLIFLFAIWLYSFQILLGKYAHKKYIIALLCMLMVSASSIIINKAYNSPYRLVSNIGSQNTEVQFLGTNGVIKVDDITAKYVNNLKQIAINSGWKERNPLIDLTGGSPGALVILNAKLVGKPWLVGGYGGSANYTKLAIKLSGINPFDSWVLTAPHGKRNNPIPSLSDTSFNFEEKYQLVGRIKTAHRNEEQLLWKPKKLAK
jgi:hypothetical protein